jgi:aconitate hydratase
MDNKSIEYLRLSGRDEKKIAFIEAYLKSQGLFRDYTNQSQDPQFTDIVEIDLSTIKPALAGPKSKQKKKENKGEKQREQK